MQGEGRGGATRQYQWMVGRLHNNSPVERLIEDKETSEEFLVAWNPIRGKLIEAMGLIITRFRKLNSLPRSDWSVYVHFGVWTVDG